MDSRQIEIYKGLKTIGNEISAFYSDGIKVANSDHDVKAYLLAHIAREIEGGLKDVLILKKEDVVVCPECTKPITKTTHKDIITSIIKALGIENEQEFVNDWFRIANKFHKYAHRHGAWKEPKDKEAFTNLWNDFSVILDKLVGNYYSISSILDIYINSEFPEDKTDRGKILGTLNNILLLESRYVYFFNNLTSKSWLKPLYEEGYFSGDKNPVPQEVEESPGYITVAYWPIFEYLTKVSKENYNKPEEVITITLLKIIDDISKYRNGKHRIVNFRTDHSLCQLIGYIPSEGINDYHFEFIKTVLTSGWDNTLISSELDEIFMKRFINEKHKKFILKLLDIVLSYQETNGLGSDKVTSLMSDYWFEQLLTNRKNEFLPICSNEIYKLITERIIEISGKFDYTFDNISTPAIEEHHQNIFPERYESQLTFLLRDCILVIPEEELNDKISELLKSSIPVFNRVAIHIIDEKYDLLSELFWEWKKNPLHGSFKYQYKHELYELLKNHADKFDAKQVERILGWIEGKEYFVSPEADKELANKIIAYQKKEWLSSILNNKDKRIEEQYKIYESINDAEPSHPGFDIWHGEAIVGYTSPLTYEQIESYSFAELIDYFEKYKSKSRSFTGPSIEGLSDIIISAIKQNPEKYCDSEHIAKASYQLQYTWTRGLIEAFREKSFDIQSVLQASAVILEDEEFWKINNTLERDNYPNFFLTELLRLIDFGLEKDHETFSMDNLPQVKSLLITVLQKDERTPYEFDELSMKSLNNSKGKLYSSIFQYLLKFGRDNKEDADKLKKEIEETVDLLFKTNICDELMYFAFGQFFPFLFTLYPDWIKNNIETVFPKHDTFKFNATLCGYFLYNSRLYLNEFNLLHESGIYEKALEYDFIKEKNGAINNLVSHILIALAENIISINDPLMDKIINSKIEQHQSSLIYRFWSPKRALIEKEKLKIVPLYIKIISNELSKGKIEQNTQVISGLSKWFNSMDKIEEEVYELQLKVSDRVKSSDKHHYLEGLRKHVNVQPEMVGNLLFALFENEVEYDISRGIISNLTEKLYQAGLKDIADKICLLHGEKGIDILKDLYKRNQN